MIDCHALKMMGANTDSSNGYRTSDTVPSAAAVAARCRRTPVCLARSANSFCHAHGSGRPSALVSLNGIAAPVVAKAFADGNGDDAAVGDAFGFALPLLPVYASNEAAVAAVSKPSSSRLVG